MASLTPFQLAAIFAGGGALLVGLCVALAYLVVWLKNKEQGYPSEAEIEAALLPIAIQGIFAAFKAGQVALDEFQKVLDGTDKAAIAVHLYDLLPATVQVGKVKLPVGLVKELYSRDQFAGLVQSAYDQFSVEFDRLQADIQAELEFLLGVSQ